MISYKAAYVTSEHTRYQTAQERWDQVHTRAIAASLEMRNQVMSSLQQLTLDFRGAVMKQEGFFHSVDPNYLPNPG